MFNDSLNIRNCHLDSDCCIHIIAKQKKPLLEKQNYETHPTARLNISKIRLFLESTFAAVGRVSLRNGDSKTVPDISIRACTSA